MTLVRPHIIAGSDLDGYSRRGIEMDRDSAHLVIAALYRDAYDMRARGGDPNIKGADRNEEIAKAIGKALL